MNFLCRNVMDSKNTNWFWVFALWSFTPMFITLPFVRSRLAARWETLSVAMSRQFPKNEIVSFFFPVQKSEDHLS